MASVISASSKSSTCIQWMWKAGVDPFSKSMPAEWKPYSDVENIIIEDACRAGEAYARLDDYYIDFKHSIQVLMNDDNKQRPIKRLVRNRDDHLPREDRFIFTPIGPKRPFGGLYGWVSPFIREVAKDLKITQKQSPSKDAQTVPMIVEKAALGILEEGQTVGKPIQVEKLAQMWMEKTDAGIKDVWTCCARLYSMECFLYKRLNETMRLIGSEEHEQVWRSKVQTLGPFCLLLWDNPANSRTTERGTILYRGANLSKEQISSIKNECSKDNKPSHRLHHAVETELKPKHSVMFYLYYRAYRLTFEGWICFERGKT